MSWAYHSPLAPQLQAAERDREHVEWLRQVCVWFTRGTVRGMVCESFLSFLTRLEALGTRGGHAVDKILNASPETKHLVPVLHHRVGELSRPLEQPR